jgi:hypothetical protein
MLSIRLSNCRECAAISGLLDAINCQLAKMAKNLYLNMAYMMDAPVEGCKMSALLHYKRILTYRANNEEWADDDYDLYEIASRVRTLTVGCDCCSNQSTGGFTTTTSTSSTTTTSTTVLTTTTTTTVPVTTTTTTTIKIVACDTPTSFSGGEDYPNVSQVTLGPDLGTVNFDFNAIGIPDKFEVWFDGVKVIDTGYRGYTSHQANLDAELILRGDPTETITQPPSGSTSFYKNSATTYAEVRVFAPLTGTAWNYTMSCPDGITTTTTTTTV